MSDQNKTNADDAEIQVVTAVANSEAVDFLESLRPGGPWVLVAIIPDGGTVGITAKTAAEVCAFVEKYNGKHNIYFSVNPTRCPMEKKAAKTDIAAGRVFDCRP